MSKKLKGFDDLLRDTLSDLELSESKANWEHLNHLIEKQKKKKIRFILFTFSLFLMLSAASLIFLPSQEKNTNSVVANKNSKEVTESIDPSVSDSISSESAEMSKNNSEKSALKNTTSANEEKNLVGNEAKKNTDEFTLGDQSTVDLQQEMVLLESDLPSQEKISLKDESNEIMEDGRVGQLLLLNSSAIEKVDSTTEFMSTDLPSNSNAFDSLTSKSEYIDSSGIATKNNSPADTIALNKITSSKSAFLSLNFYAGLNFYSANRAASTSQNNIAPLVGFELKHPFSPHLAVGLGALYSLQGGYHLPDTATLESYFLDHNISQEIIDIRQLHKLYLPLTFYYNPADRHSISFSIQGSYLINTNGDYTQIYQTSQINNYTQIINAKGYMDGIKSINISLSLGYNFSLAKRLDLGARITRELNDAYTADYFYGIDAKPSWSLQTFLIVKFE